MFRLKVITQEQFYQIFGLILANIQNNKKSEILADSFAEIVGEENRDRFWDFYDSITEKELKEKLGFDKVIIKENKK